ncbi:unnamed protein product, partial [Didymodactylos carnosus]
MFGRHPVLPLDHTSRLFQFNRPNDYWMHMMKAMNVYREAALQRIRPHQQHSKQRFDRNRNDPQYEINDSVLWKLPGH